jgi:hypothetical protein
MKLYNFEVDLKSLSDSNIAIRRQCVVLAKDDNDANNKIVAKFGERLAKYTAYYDNDIVLIDRID